MASSATHNKEIDKLLRDIPRQGIAGYASELRKILEKIVGATRLTIDVDGLEIAETKDGFRLRNPSSANASHPFKCTASGTDVVITPGDYNGAPPTVGGSALTEPRTLALATGTRHVYLKLTYALTASAGGYVYSSSLTTAEITIESSLQSDPFGPSTSIFWIRLASFTDRVKTSQPVRTSLSGALEDHGMLDSKAELTVSEA